MADAAMTMAVARWREAWALAQELTHARVPTFSVETATLVFYIAQAIVDDAIALEKKNDR